MEMIHLNVGRLQTNCFIVWAEGSTGCAVIDPGDEPQRILQHVQNKGRAVEAVLLTHGHFDHVGGVKELHRLTSCKVYMNIKELALPEQLTAGPLFYTHTYVQGDKVTVDGLTFEVLETPGHSEGSVCLLCGDTMFSGDTLFAGSCGRTDLPTGSWSAIGKSLAYLAQLPADYTVYPGHGPATTLNTERVQNPYINEHETNAYWT